MLKPEQNQALMEVGPGTLMGGLLRRYWTPFAAAGELDQQSTKAVRLMGEDLVLYRDGSGNLGLVDRHCPHRRADLSYGWVEECGLRGRDFFLAGYSLRDVADGQTSAFRYPRQFIFQAGQPEEVTEAYRAAMGMDRVAEYASPLPSRE
jgi:phenylpropionate dioxygenase-like ring-hydroxylating dioxygenase large terminal subunit